MDIIRLFVLPIFYCIAISLISKFLFNHCWWEYKTSADLLRWQWKKDIVIILFVLLPLGALILSDTIWPEVASWLKAVAIMLFWAYPIMRYISDNYMRQQG